MQFFTYQGFGLRKAPFQIRVLITSFIAMVTLGLGVGMINYQLRTGLAARGSMAWYQGGISGDDKQSGNEETALYAKTPLELMDATHPHLFNQAFLFFVLGHILALCAISSRLKVATYTVGFAGVAIDTASPWLIRFVSPGFAYLQLAGHLAMGLAFVSLAFFPLWEMWGRWGKLS